MGLITKHEVVVAPVPMYDLGGGDVCAIDGYPIDVCSIDICSIDGGIAVTTPQKFTPICPLCNEPVVLETCKADEQGRAVHEHCYAMKVTIHRVPQPPSNPSSESGSI